MWAKIRAERVSPRVCCPARAAGELDFFVRLHADLLAARYPS